MSVLERYHELVAAGRVQHRVEQDVAAARLDRLAHDIAVWRPGIFRKNVPPRGLYMWGDVGRGKSMLMDLFFAEVVVVPKRRVHFNAFMAEAHALLHALRKLDHIHDPLPQVAKRLEQKLICFDEVQVEDVADAMILGRLFQHLLARGTVIVATSNTPPDRLYQHGLNRSLFLPFIAVLKLRMDVAQLGGEDHRRTFTGELFQTGPNASTMMDGAWQALGGSHERPAALDVLGRRLVIARTAGKAARFTFAELCQQPLGPADYLAIAAAFGTVLIDDIPVFGPQARDAARRFQTLIDMLYDQRVRLICSAAAPPDGLFPESDGTARTVSRLLEMRGGAYTSQPCSGT